MKAVIMSAGKSTRTYPLTLTRPKALLPVANVPLVERQLDALEGVIDEAVLVVGYRHEMLRAHLGEEYRGIRIRYVMQEEQRGTGHAVLQCEGLVEEPFLCINGDDLWEPADLRAVARQTQAALVKEVADPRLYAICEVDAEDNLLRMVEKPTEIFSTLANIGAYKFTPEVFEVLRHTPPSIRGEIEITAAIETLAKKGPFKVVRSQGYWLAIGYPWHLLDANAYWLDHFMPQESEGEISPLAIFKGPVSVGRGTVIKPGVYAEGPVLIGEDCEIGPNCFLRAGTSIGNHCKVGQGCEIKNSILMDGAKVPHLSYVGDSIIGAGANLGCGTVIANFRHDGKTHRSAYGGQLVDTGRRKFGAVIGDDVHTGINTSIYPGRKLWPHTSTLPGEIVQQDRTS
jgi:UDP-N-acetylglucosamine diphosphorylase/glucosamine-1-phosphate N-acetyltransferase